MLVTQKIPSLFVGCTAEDIDRFSDQFDLGPVIAVADTYEGYDVMMTQPVDALIYRAAWDWASADQFRQTLHEKTWCRYRRFLSVTDHWVMAEIEA